MTENHQNHPVTFQISSPRFERKHNIKTELPPPSIVCSRPGISLEHFPALVWSWMKSAQRVLKILEGGPLTNQFFIHGMKNNPEKS